LLLTHASAYVKPDDGTSVPTGVVYCEQDVVQGKIIFYCGFINLDGRKIIKWIFKKWDGAWTGLSWLRIGTGSVSCECGNEPQGSIKCGEFLPS
jgi:hypothetical protein